MNHSTQFIEDLCRHLVDQKVLSFSEIQPLTEAFAGRSDIGFEYFLLEQGLVTRPDLLNALSAMYQVPAMDVEGALFDHNLVRMFPKGEMLREGFIPLEHDGETLIVVAAHPDNENLLVVIGDYVSYDVVFYVGLYQDICDMVKEFYDESLELVEFEEQEKAEDLAIDADIDEIINS